MRFKKWIFIGLFSLSMVVLAVNYILNSSYKTKPTRSVYYWKTEFNLDSATRIWFSQNGIKKIYVKLFEVNKSWDNKLYPGSTINRLSEVKEQEIVPVVFIENEALNLLNSEEKIATLARNIVTKAGCTNELNTSAQGPNRPFKELQIDCDWTLSTKATYFSLLSKIKALNKKLTVSVTLRLYPFKYQKTMGIPPVDRAMLMVYNLENPRDYKVKNSIFSEEVAKSYLADSKPYPLPLDVVMPAFEWFREFNSSYEFEYFSNGEDNDPHWDSGPRVIRNDTITVSDLKAISVLTKRLIDKKGSVSFFECTPRLLKFNTTEINEILEIYSK